MSVFKGWIGRSEGPTMLEAMDSSTLTVLMMVRMGGRGLGLGVFVGREGPTALGALLPGEGCVAIQLYNLAHREKVVGFNLDPALASQVEPNPFSAAHTADSDPIPHIPSHR